jgi:putative transposase
MQVSPSGYYAWGKRAPNPRETANQQLTEKIKIVFLESDQTYGSPRIYEELKEQPMACSQKRVARLMRLCDLKAVLPKRFVVTTHSNHALPVADNVLDRQFRSDTPHTRWTADITYIWTAEGWLYLGVVLDLFSRRIVGWAMGANRERWLVLSALEMSIQNRPPQAGLLCHSDRGSQ